MKQTTSPSQRIYDLYAEYERKGMDTTPITEALKKATGTTGMDNVEVVRKWIEEMCKMPSTPF